MELLKMIETVDPTDIAKLDEIDARVEAYLKNGNYHSHWRNCCEVLVCFTGEQPNSVCGDYTRSRDALKAIRPEGTVIGMICAPEVFVSTLHYKDKRPGFRSNTLPTEELAELHAIIQAIEYERTNP